MELYISHEGLKRFAHRIKRAKDNYLAKLVELSKGFYSLCVLQLYRRCDNLFPYYRGVPIFQSYHGTKGAHTYQSMCKSVCFSINNLSCTYILRSSHLLPYIKVLFIIDTSSSMTGFFEELRTALTDFLNNRPNTLK